MVTLTTEMGGVDGPPPSENVENPKGMRACGALFQLRGRGDRTNAFQLAIHLAGP